MLKSVYGLCGVAVVFSSLADASLLQGPMSGFMFDAQYFKVGSLHR